MSTNNDFSKRIAITGSPGCGKSTLSELLSDNYPAEEVVNLAKKYQCISSSKSNDDPSIVDIEELSLHLSREWEKPPLKSTLIVGHLSHLLPVDAIIILRCNPVVLESRLNSRNWNNEKVNSNVEWEMMGGPWQELVELDQIPNSLELDNTSIDLVQQTEIVNKWVRQNCPQINSISNIDWISELHE